MKIFFLLCFALSFPFLLLASASGLKKEGKKQAEEAQEWGEQQRQQLLKSGWDSGVNQNELLPEEDKNREFRLGQMETTEIKSLVGLAKKKEVFEGTEKFFQQGEMILENPEKSIGIVATQSKNIPAEETLIRCEEGGTYYVSFIQKRIIKDLPSIKTQMKKCRGHLEISVERFFWESSAEDFAKKIRKKLAKDSTLQWSVVEVSKTAGIRNYLVTSQWLHRDNAENCPFSSQEDVFTQPLQEEDFWQTDTPEDLSSIESNPNCRLLYSQITEGPEVRNINGQSLFRDHWGRQLFFFCEPTMESPCATLRKRGGALVKKRCLKVNHFEECDLWEKTYDLGKKAAFQEKTHSFSEEEIWGLNPVFDSVYEKNGDLPIVVSTLSLFSDLKREMECAEKGYTKDIEIFRGEPKQCQCSFIKGVLYDCCKKMNGLAVSTYLAKCNSEEQALAEQRFAGKCHHIGSKKENLGTQTTQVFCCFPTKLARIFHEEGRKQLAIKWGNADSPQCRGFTLDELQQIDFTKIDFSDAFEDALIDKDELLQKVQSTIETLRSNGQGAGKVHTDLIVQKQQEGIKNDL